MFEGLRKNSQTFLFVILIASLAILFGTQFGPGSRGCSRDQLRVSNVARVYGATITEQDFQSVARLTSLSERRNGAVWRQAIVDGLIERELLAHEAERLGFAVDEDDVNRDIRDGYFYISLGTRQLAQLVGGLGMVPTSARQHTSYARGEGRSPTDPPPPFRYEDFEQWVRGAFGRTVPDYKKLMRREMLAERMREIAMATVRAPEEEVWRDYERGHTQVTIQYLQFAPDFYRDTVNADDRAAVTAWAGSHTEEINRAYEQRRESLRGLPAQVRVRSLMLRFPDDATDAQRAQIEARATEIRRRIEAGTLDFVRAARLYSQDDENWRTAGESGWGAVDRLNLPEDVKRALADVPANSITQPIRAGVGVFLVQILGRRSGDVSESDAKAEIARELYLETRARELANEAATRAQTLLGAAGATLDSVATTVHNEALRGFFRGEVPASETLAAGNTLEPVSRTDVGGPEVRETPPFTQAGSIPGIQNGDAVVAAAFQLTAEHPAPTAPVASGDERFIIRLKDNGRQNASRDEFNRDRARSMADYVAARRREVLQEYVARLRSTAERAGDVRVGDSPLLRAPSAGSSTPAEAP